MSNESNSTIAPSRSADRYIFLVGKGDPQQSMATAIRDAGYHVGLFHDAQLKLRSPDLYDRVVELDFEALPEDIAELLPDIAVDGLVCTYENYIVAKAQLAEQLAVASCSIETARLCTDKHLMRIAFAQYDTSLSPAFTVVESLQHAQTFTEKHGFPVILKPTNLVKSLLVLRCNNEQELSENLAYAQEHITELYASNHIHGRRAQLILEQYVVGQLCSIAAFVDDKGTPHFCKGITHLQNASEVGYDDNFLYSRILPATIQHNLEKNLFAAAERAIRALGMRSSPAHVEMIYTPAGDITIVEIGARIGGYRPRMYQLSYGIDLSAQEVALCLGKQPDLNGSFKAYSAVYELFPKKEGLFQKISSDTNEIDTTKFAYFSVKPRQSQLVGSAKAGFRACAVILISAHDLASFKAQRHAAEQLRVEIT